MQLLTDKLPDEVTNVMANMVEMLGTDSTRIVLSYGAAYDMTTKPNDLDIYVSPETFKRAKTSCWSPDIDNYSILSIDQLPATLFLPAAEVIKLKSEFWEIDVSIHSTVDDRYMDDINVVPTDAGWYVPTAYQLVRDYVDLLGSNCATSNKYIEKIQNIIKRVGTHWLYRPKDAKYLMVCAQLFHKEFSECPLDSDQVKRVTVPMKYKKGDKIEIFSHTFLPPVVETNEPYHTRLLCSVGDYIKVTTSEFVDNFKCLAVVERVFKVIDGDVVVRQVSDVDEFSEHNYGGRNIYDVIALDSLEKLKIQQTLKLVTGFDGLNSVCCVTETTADPHKLYSKIKSDPENLMSHISSIYEGFGQAFLGTDYKCYFGRLRDTLMMIDNCTTRLFYIEHFKTVQELDGEGCFIAIHNDSFTLTIPLFIVDFRHDQQHISKTLQAMYVGKQSEIYDIRLNALMRVEPHVALLQQFS